jgi:hypothetical protein
VFGMHKQTISIAQARTEMAPGCARDAWNV